MAHLFQTHRENPNKIFLRRFKLVLGNFSVWLSRLLGLCSFTYLLLALLYSTIIVLFCIKSDMENSKFGIIRTTYRFGATNMRQIFDENFATPIQYLGIDYPGGDDPVIFGIYRRGKFMESLPLHLIANGISFAFAGVLAGMVGLNLSVLFVPLIFYTTTLSYLSSPMLLDLAPSDYDKALYLTVGLQFVLIYLFCLFGRVSKTEA